MLSPLLVMLACGLKLLSSFSSGRVFNVTRRAVGVLVNKRIKNRFLAKRINVRVEHVKHSTCRQDFLDRVQRNDARKTEAKLKGLPMPNNKRLVCPSLLTAKGEKKNKETSERTSRRTGRCLDWLVLCQVY